MAALRTCECTDCDPFDACDICDGTGLSFWAWTSHDDGECGECHAGPVPVDQWGEDGEEPVCWPCAVAMHKRGCGCVDATWAVVPEESGE
jgi:hypothetical protein